MAAEQFQVGKTGSTQRLSLSGTVNVFVVTAFCQAAVGLLAAGDTVEVDCTNLTALDGSACQILLALKRDLAARGLGFTLTGAPEGVRRFLRSGGMDTLVTEVAA